MAGLAWWLEFVVVAPPFLAFNEDMIKLPLRAIVVIVLAAMVSGGCRTSAPEKQTVFRSEKLAQIDQAVLQAIAEKRCPGGIIWLEH
ncbi:MAG TPA: hypothetical protein VN673_18420, partial [Clostridia bacterium]|nr:hypothetical protein [Clostridia bacterium]